ncbi:MAG: nucleotidyl transferase AbiEii/AbiGii toxin family protein [Candidatus Methanomethylophilus sp.]|nr:nucleotidyl transferase AbiEii/AbiGii toxin family protein [Methanomethylophilus sp.]
MNILSSLMEEYPSDYVDAMNTVNQYCQEITLCGLWRAGFFGHMAFQGGTALRIFHGLDRFSEDLDFCSVDRGYVLDPESMGSYVENEFRSLGLEFEMAPRRSRGDIRGGTVSGNTRDTLERFGFPEDMLDLIRPDTRIRIKIDLDTETPDGYRTEHRFRTHPFNYGITLLDIPSLFAAKISAAVSRRWENRVKGRDLYDLDWYVREGARVNKVYLINNLIRQGVVSEPPADDGELREILCRRFDCVDYDKAYEDLYPFVHRSRLPKDWDADYFRSLVNGLVFE